MSGEMVHVGFGNILAIKRVIAIAAPNSAPTKRTIQEARNRGVLIDMTNGRRTQGGQSSLTAAPSYWRRWPRDHHRRLQEAAACDQKWKIETE
jgi:hypothetical protein